MRSCCARSSTSAQKLSPCCSRLRLRRCQPPICSTVSPTRTCARDCAQHPDGPPRRILAGGAPRGPGRSVAGLWANACSGAQSPHPAPDGRGVDASNGDTHEHRPFARRDPGARACTSKYGVLARAPRRGRPRRDDRRRRAAVVALISGAFTWLVLVGVAGGAMYWVRRQSATLRGLERQAPAAIEMVSAALRAGYSVPQAMARVARESPNQRQSSSDELSGNCPRVEPRGKPDEARQSDCAARVHAGQHCHLDPRPGRWKSPGRA